MELNKFSLNIYSFGLSAGFICNDRIKNSPNRKMDLDRLCSFVKEKSLGGIEFPIDHFFFKKNPQDSIEFIKNTELDGLSVFIDIENLDENYLKIIIPQLSDLGHSSVRIKMLHLDKVFYGGNRYLSKKFKNSLNNFIKTLNNLLPLLEKYSFKLLIENHQDLSSIELVEIINNLSSEHIGINWDVGNSYSVFDTPKTFLKNAGNYIGNVHLKDYRITATENGYKLIRCALGDGVIKFNEIIPELINKYNVKKMSIELGAQLSRECNINVDNYWEAYKETSIPKEEFKEHIKELTSTENEIGSLYEQGVDISKVAELELNEIDKSINYLQSL